MKRLFFLSLLLIPEKWDILRKQPANHLTIITVRGTTFP